MKTHLLSRRLLAGVVVLFGVFTASATEWTYEGGNLKTSGGWAFPVAGATRTNYEGVQYSGVLLKKRTAVGTETDLDFRSVKEQFNIDIIELANEAFRDTAVTSVLLPDTVVYIGDGTFRGCSSLVTLEPLLPSGVYWIGNYAFNGCSKIEGKLELALDGHKLEFHSTGNNFSYCSSLSEIVFGEGVTSFPNTSFRGCSSMTNLTLSTKTTSIGASAFRDCSSLKHVTPFLPPTVTSVANYAFGGCPIEDALTLGSSEDGAANFSFVDSTGSQFTSQKLPSVLFLESVRSIGGGSPFNGCGGLTNVEFRSDVTMGGPTFNNCKAVRQVRFGGSATWGTNKPFQNWNQWQARFLVPSGNVDWQTQMANNLTKWEDATADQYRYTNLFPGEDEPTPYGYLKDNPAKIWLVVEEKEVTTYELRIYGVKAGDRIEDQRPVNAGEVSPSYGEDHTDVSVPLVCTAPVRGRDGNTVYACDGAIIETLEGADWVNPVTNHSNTVTYNPSQPCVGRLVWQWREVGYNAVVSYPEELGTVTASEFDLDGSYSAGSVATFTAEAKPGATFVRWFGDVDEATCSNAEISVTMDRVKKLVPYFRSDWVIVGSNMTDGYWTIPVSGTSSARALATPTAWPAVAAELDLRKPITSGDTITEIKDNFLYYAANHVRIVRLPNTVTSIGSNAFRGQSTLVTVDPLVPASVTSIGTRAFSDCSNLASPVEIGNARKHPGVTFHSDGYTFECDYSLRTAVLGVGVKDVVKGLFNQCGGIKELTILSDELNSVGYGAFRINNQTLPSCHYRFASWPNNWGDQPFMNWTSHKVCVYVPKGDAGWQAFMDDPTEMRAWTNLTTTQQQAFSNNFPNATQNPKGMTLKGANVSGGHGMGNQWIFLWNPKPSGMRIIFR